MIIPTGLRSETSPLLLPVGLMVGQTLPHAISNSDWQAIHWIPVSIAHS